MLSGCLGGVNLFCIHINVEALTCRLRGCLGGVHSFSTEWLPRWGQTVVASVGCLGGVNPKNILSLLTR